MRILDFSLGLFGLLALGLVFSPSSTVLAAGPTPPLGVDFAHPGSAAGANGVLEWSGKGMGEGLRLDSTRLGCCLERSMTPAESAARARALERLLVPRGSSSQARFDRLRVDLLLQRELDIDGRMGAEGTQEVS